MAAPSSKIRHLCGRQSQLIQNGIDTEKLKFLGNKIGLGDITVSVRGMDPKITGIEEILLGKELFK